MISFQNAYLPTMEEDHLQEARRALGGTFYGVLIANKLILNIMNMYAVKNVACPRGHPYYVGEVRFNFLMLCLYY